ncbi:alkene reductase [Amycolatopsis rhabdoformis]|uniref:Alkene reductase n=1 Tax=Amycolatopsis rhabdoformis TaxID=1448059 RepID=A0ABZ1ICZ2_9PSEU|nr:alkene reductase [Amycolatopsis rhabdoformis]WSE31601.1 alkene reductase [Amycolatopsis rhabdoformis]
MPGLWSPVEVGRLRLPHRLALSPMMRNRALPDGSPTPLDAEYFAQRASLGLLITGGTQPSADGQGFLLSHGCHTDAHIAGWQLVTKAVHDAGGHLFIQLMHAGRVAHPHNTPHGRTPVAPSPVAAGVGIHTPTGNQPVPVPRELTTAQVRATVEDFRRAAAAAIEAGADGVEIHGANGFLLQQFLSANANHRTDAYGGSVAARTRFVLEVTEAVAGEIGADRTALRLSPGLRAFGIDEGATGPATYTHLVRALARLDLAFLHVTHHGDDALLATVRAAWPGPLLLTRPGAPVDERAADVDSGLADLITLGRPALANPDVVARLRTGAPLNAPDPTTFYGGGAEGYTDYPTL